MDNAELRIGNQGILANFLPSTIELGANAKIIIEADGYLKWFANSNIIFGSGAAIEVYGTVEVGSNATLDIQNGWNFVIHPGAQFKMGDNASIQVSGTLHAPGTQQSPIAFSLLPGASQWNGITNSGFASTISLNSVNLSNTTYGVNVNSATTLTVENSAFSNCTIGINVTPTPFGASAPIQINNNTFSGFPLYSTGISIDGTSNVFLSYNTLTGPGTKGTGVLLNASSPQMLNNTIQSWKFGLTCLNGSSPLLEQGFNVITSNNTGVFCDNSNAVLGFDVGENTLCLNIVDVQLVSSKVDAIKNRWRSNQEPPGVFNIDPKSTLNYDPWGDQGEFCSGTAPILAGGKGNEGGEAVTPLSPLMRQILRARARGNYAQAEGLLRAAVANRNVTDEEKIWALGQMLAVGQRMRNGNLAAFFNSLTSNGTLRRKARAMLPMSFMHEGSFAQAIAAYDANILNYPNSGEARAGLYGKFIYSLHAQYDTSFARQLLNSLNSGYPQSVEAENAEIQMRAFRLPSSSPSGNPTGGLQKGTGLASVNLQTNVPTEFSLAQNYPNPFNPSTTIRFAVPQDERVTLKVFDMLGREVATLVNEMRDAGSYDEVFDASTLSSGVYIYKLTAGNFSASKKLAVVK